MSGINKVIIVGRLGQDPEIKELDNGGMVTKMSVATSESWKDRDGNKQEKTEWHRCVAFGKVAEICGKYLEKGRQVYFEGSLQTRSWEGEDGVKKYSTEVVVKQMQFIGDKGDKPEPVKDYGHAETSLDSTPSFDSNEPIPNFAPGQSHGPALNDNETPGF